MNNDQYYLWLVHFCRHPIIDSHDQVSASRKQDNMRCEMVFSPTLT